MYKVNSMVKFIQERLNTVFSDLIFDSQRHLYFVEGVRYPSVSSKVEGHAEEFDEQKWLAYCSIRDKIPEEKLKFQWRSTNADACELGHRTHDFCEHYTGVETPRTPQEKAGIKFFAEIIKDYYIIAREIRMYTRQYKYAGTADLLLMHRETGKIVLADYKTNKDLFKTFGMLLEPFAYLECCPYNKYQLQLSYYQIMLEDAGIQVDERLLVYLKADGEYEILTTFNYTPYIREHLIKSKKSIAHEYNW